MTAFHSHVETLGTDDVNPGEGLRRAARLAGGLVVGAGTLLVGASAFIGHAITRPRRLRVIATREVDETVEVVTFLTDDGRRCTAGTSAPPGRPCRATRSSSATALR